MMQNTLFRPSVIRENRKKFNPEGFDLTAAIEARKAAEAKPIEEKIELPAAESHRTRRFKADPIELVNGIDSEIVIRAAYKQVFGNAHIMESERCITAESQLRSGEITVLEFVRTLAKSDRYQDLFLNSCTNLRTVELNFKHLLGRPPADQNEISEHIKTLVEEGFESEIDSYVDSQEYFEQFGTNIVPYYRGFDSQVDKTVSTYNNSFELIRGNSSSDKSINYSKEVSFNTGVLENTSNTIRELPSSREFLEGYKKPSENNVNTDPMFMGIPLDNQEYKSSEFLAKPRVENWLQEYRGREAAATFPAARRSQPVRLADNSEETLDLVIRAAYKQVFGNVHLMESQRLDTADSQLRNGQISISEFVRQLALSETYKSLFFDSCPNIRAVELNFKHLLGRTPDNQAEVSAHLAILETEGYEAEINSYIDSEEYQTNFGQYTVPYYVGYSTQTGKGVAGYNRIFKLIKGECSSDRTISETIQSSQKSQLQSDILQKIDISVPAVFNPEGFDLGQSLLDAGAPPTPRETTISDPFFSSQTDTNPVEFIPGSSQDVEAIVNAVYKQVFGNAYLMESEKSPQIESQFRSGEISVLEFVRSLALSEQYRKRFFEPCSNVQAIKLNFKHLLGRAPESDKEISEHIQIIANGGFEEEINSYIDSSEYFTAYGTNTVPYFRGYSSQVGKSLTSFTHSFQLERGLSSSDKSVLTDISDTLNQNLLGNNASEIEAISTADPSLPKSGRSITAAAAPLGGPEKTARNNYSTQSYGPSAVPEYPIGVFRRNTAEPQKLQTQQRNAWESQSRTSSQSTPVSLMPGSSEQETEIVINEAYKQVFGNAHIMESERLTIQEAQVKSGTLSVREFIRALAKSELYKSRFIANAPRYKTHELNFKHLLGRAPDSYDETISHSNILDSQGYEADIDSYIDSDEYQNCFGENTVPYSRGYQSQVGTGLLSYTSNFAMRDSVSTSDKDLIEASQARAPKPLYPAQPRPLLSMNQVTDATDLIRKVLNLA